MEAPLSSASSSPVGGDAARVAVWYGADGGSEHARSVRLCREVDLAYPRHEPGQASALPVATCSYHYRYANTAGAGGLKYQPVKCSAIHQADRCQVLRQQRGGGGRLQLRFDLVLPPGCRDFRHKVMVVPTIGCPERLAKVDFCRKLLWAARAAGRPTFLSVHLSEAAHYLETVGDTMRALGVGIVAWECDQGVLGFGASRLAAQQFGRLCGGRRTEVVMCDVNVVEPNRRSTRSGYGTDDEDGTYQSKRTGVLFYASGSGTGVPRYGWNGTQLTEQPGEKGGSGRPLEQLVVVDSGTCYDPCFVMSSEDANLTDAFLSREQQLRPRASVKTFRAGLDIRKVEMGPRTCEDYANRLALFLDGLAGEREFVVTYEERDRSVPLRVGDLALLIAHGNHVTRAGQRDGSKPLVHPGYLATPLAPDWATRVEPEEREAIEEEARRIRSLIVEQILLTHLKRERRALKDGQAHAEEGSKDEEDGDDEDGDDEEDEEDGKQDGEEKALRKPLRRHDSTKSRPRKTSLAAARSSSGKERKKPQGGGLGARRDCSPSRGSARAQDRSPPRRLRAHSSPERGRKRDRSEEEGSHQDRNG